MDIIYDLSLTYGEQEKMLINKNWQLQHCTRCSRTSNLLCYVAVLIFLAKISNIYF